MKVVVVLSLAALRRVQQCWCMLLRVWWLLLICYGGRRGALSWPLLRSDGARTKRRKSQVGRRFCVICM